MPRDLTNSTSGQYGPPNGVKEHQAHQFSDIFVACAIVCGTGWHERSMTSLRVVRSIIWTHQWKTVAIPYNGAQ